MKKQVSKSAAIKLKKLALLARQLRAGEDFQITRLASSGYARGLRFDSATFGRHSASNLMVGSRSKKAHSRQQVETVMSSSCIHQFGFPMLILTAHLLAGCAAASNKPLHDISQGAETVQGMAVVAGCASCIFDMPGATGCDLAVKIDGTAYLVTGSDIDDHGDAHASAGLCNASRDAVVEGRIDGDRLVATHFVLKPDGR